LCTLFVLSFLLDLDFGDNGSTIVAFSVSGFELCTVVLSSLVDFDNSEGSFDLSTSRFDLCTVVLSFLVDFDNEEEGSFVAFSV